MLPNSESCPCTVPWSVVCAKIAGAAAVAHTSAAIMKAVHRNIGLHIPLRGVPGGTVAGGAESVLVHPARGTEPSPARTLAYARARRAAGARHPERPVPAS